MNSKALRKNLKFPANYNEKRAFTLEEQQETMNSVKNVDKSKQNINVEDKSSLYIEETIRTIVSEVFKDVKDELIKKIISLLLKEKTTCVLCHRVIGGIHYSCSECPDYIICAFCEENEAHHHDLVKERHFKSNLQ